MTKQRSLGIFPLIFSLLLALAPARGAEDPATFKVGDLTFKRPAAWKWVAVGPGMRKAQLQVTDEKSKQAAEVVFFQFGGGQGGGVQANIARWLGQFQEPKEQLKTKVEKVMIGKSSVTHVEAQGTYMSGLPGGPKTAMPNHTLLGAIIEAEDGNIFIKFTSPNELAKSSREDFRKMVASALEK